MTNSTDKLDWKQERPFYLVLAIVGLIIAIIFYLIPKNSGQINMSSLASIDNLVLDKDPKLEKIKGGEKILIQAKGYNKLFQVTGNDFNFVSKKEILNNIISGDTISVKMDSAEFKSLDRQTLFDKFIEIHSLTKDGQEYLNIKIANSKATADLGIGIPCGLYLMVAGLIYWSFKTRPKLSAKITISLGALLLIFILRN